MSTLAHLANAAADTLLAAPDPAPGGPNLDKVKGFLIYTVAPLLVIAVGIGILLKARKGNMAEALGVSGVTLLALVFIVGGAVFFTLAGGLAGLLS